MPSGKTNVQGKGLECCWAQQTNMRMYTTEHEGMGMCRRDQRSFMLAQNATAVLLDSDNMYSLRCPNCGTSVLPMFLTNLAGLDPREVETSRWAGHGASSRGARPPGQAGEAGGGQRW